MANIAGRGLSSQVALWWMDVIFSSDKIFSEGNSRFLKVSRGKCTEKTIVPQGPGKPDRSGSISVET